MSDDACYSVGEVRFLLSLTEQEAGWFDIGPRSWLGQLQGDGSGLTVSSSSGPPLPVRVRWYEVQAAKRRIASRDDRALLALRLEDELTSEQAGAALGVSERQVRRRLRSVSEAIVDELGGPAPTVEADRLTDLVEAALAKARAGSAARDS